MTAIENSNERVANKLAGCDGCRSFTTGMYQCDNHIATKYLTEHYLFDLEKCPCGECLIKMVCVSGCNDYTKFTLMVNDVVKKLGHDTEIQHFIDATHQKV